MAKPSSDEEANGNNTVEQGVPSSQGAGQSSGCGLEKIEKIYIGVMVLAVLAIALTLGLVFGLKKEDEIVFEPADGTPSPASMTPSEAPSSAPTGSLDLLMMDLPNSTLANIQNFGTPQYQAWEWLSSHQNVTNLPEWRKKQLFALATFFYAFEGPNWIGDIDWLDEERDECLWFSSNYGSFCNGQYTEGGYVQVDICNYQGEYQALALSCLRLSDYTPTIPPELALLTSLEYMFLPQNNITMPLSDMIPSELSGMANLAHISFASNSLNGTIPENLFQGFTALKFLDLSDNVLTGIAPELNLDTFIINGNNFSG